MLPPASWPVRGEVRVWHAGTADLWADPRRMTGALGWLEAHERARYDRYRGDADRAMFLLGRVMARTLVGRALEVPPTAWRWREGPRGRPEIVGAESTLSFNLAHSAGLVVCALRREGAVGVDVEHRDRRAIDARLVRRYCAPAEIADIEGQLSDAWQDQFLRYWTLKEAYLKARGLGIAVPLADLSFRIAPEPVTLVCLNSLAGENTEWAFALDELADRHFVAAAAPVAHGDRPRFVVEPFPDDLWL